jgi:hypothetical protein
VHAVEQVGAGVSIGQRRKVPRRVVADAVAAGIMNIILTGTVARAEIRLSASTIGIVRATSATLVTVDDVTPADPR